MIRSIVMHDIPMSQIAAMERWYYQLHGPEISRRYGPWLSRHESYSPVDAPADARAYGFFNWRLTDCWWREIPLAGPQGTLAFSLPPVTPVVATCFIPAQPSEDFLGHEIQPTQRNVLRWLILMKYPAGVSRQQGDDWFLNVHAKEVMRQPGLFRFFSHRTIEESIGLPGTWPAEEIPNIVKNLMPKWDRMVELWYETFDDWRRSVVTEPPAYTKPAWARHDRYPFLEPRVDFASTFILERPVDEFLRDSRGYV